MGASGAVLADGSVLGTRDFEGVESVGMLLSAAELGIPEAADEFGILRLPAETAPGEDVKHLLGLDDAILDLSVTPNRGDLLSMLGVAREVYALFPEATWKMDLTAFPANAMNAEWPVDFKGITLKDDGCPLYCLGLITGLKSVPSPLRTRILLTLLGMRPISAMVDATNYAMLMLGQPTHAFDADRLPSPEITVRSAADGEETRTLDGKNHRLEPGDMLITSGGLAVGIAGVMGGENSEILESTRTVFLESANFDAIRVSRTSRRLGISSEAAFRYARIVDTRIAQTALKYISSLLEEWGAAEGGYAILSASTKLPEEKSVTLTKGKLKKILLTEDMKEASAILSRLGLVEISSTSETATYSVPSWRPDISIEEDLIEEVGRIRGYNETLESRLPQALYGRGDIGHTTRLKGEIRSTLLSRGYVELVNYSFLSPSFVELLRLPAADRRARPLLLANPMSVEQSRMRTTLLPGMLRSVEQSVASGWKTAVRVFELGRVFFPLDEGGHEEIERICGVAYGGKDSRLPYGPADADDLFSLKADILALAESRGVVLRFVQGGALRPQGADRAPVLRREGRGICFASSRRSKRSLTALRSLLLNWIWSRLKRLRSRIQRTFFFPSGLQGYLPLRPLAESMERVAEHIREEGGSLLRDVRLFDMYSGKGVPEGFRGLAFSLAYKRDDRTLTDKEVDEVNERVRSRMSSSGYVLR